MSNYAIDVTAAVSQEAGDFIPGRVGRKGLLIRNLGDDTVFVGNEPTVTADDGFPIQAGETLTLTRGMGGIDLAAPIYPICAAAQTAELRVWDNA
jgi:hypothetical protein